MKKNSRVLEISPANANNAQDHFHRKLSFEKTRPAC